MEAVYINNSSADFRNQNPEKSVFRSYSWFHGGTSNSMLYTSPFSHSYNSYSSPSVYHNRRHHQQNQPPLLPLPISKHYQKRVKINTNNHRSLTVRKSSSSVVNSGREKPKYQSEKLISSNSANNQIGPDPKDVPRAFFLCSSDVNGNQVNNFSGSVVSTVLSPPPTSLPLPTFSLRLKTSCNTEAAAGATDNLRRILRLC